jgi:hypothetical protein
VARIILFGRLAVKNRFLFSRDDAMAVMFCGEAAFALDLSHKDTKMVCSFAACRGTFVSLCEPD